MCLVYFLNNYSNFCIHFVLFYNRGHLYVALVKIVSEADDGFAC